MLDDETNDPEYNFIAENEQEEEDEEERRCDKGVEITSKLLILRTILGNNFYTWCSDKALFSSQWGTGSGFKY